MGPYTLSKIDIDVLVQLAMVGPWGARHWEPLTDEPDALGARLWRRNRQVAPDDEELSPSAYRFELLPIEITAVEGLTQISNYRYQTARVGSVRDGTAKFIQELTYSLIPHLDGWDEAPWGWTAVDLLRRASRPAPVIPGQEPLPEVDPATTSFLATWAVTGLALEPADVGPEYLAKYGDPRQILGVWRTGPVGQLNMPGMVFVCRDEATAHNVHLAQRAELQGAGDTQDAAVTRFGLIVISSVFYTRHASLPPGPDPEVRWGAKFRAGLAHLGEADEAWSSLDPPLASVDAEVVATQVLLRDTLRGRSDVNSKAVVARTPKDISCLAGMVADPAVRDQILAINPRTHSAILLGGVAEASHPQQGIVTEFVSRHRKDPTAEHVLRIRFGEATRAVATLIVVGRTPRRPLYVEVAGRHEHHSLMGWRPWS